jgi:hypothetical protein
MTASTPSVHIKVVFTGRKSGGICSLRDILCDGARRGVRLLRLGIAEETPDLDGSCYLSESWGKGGGEEMEFHSFLCVQLRI